MRNFFSSFFVYFSFLYEKKKFILTISRFRCMRFSRFTWFTLSSFVDSTHTELVIVAVYQIRNFTLRFWRLSCKTRFPSWAVSFFLFNDVTRNGRSTVTFRRFPLEVHVVFIPVYNVGCAWWTWFIYKKSNFY